MDASTLLTGPDGDVLRLAPLTYIADEVPAGATVLRTVSLSELGMTPRSPFFAVGDQVVIDPGGSDEEFATLVSVHPFTLSPLTATERLHVEEYLRERAQLAPFVAPGSLALDQWEVAGCDLGAAPAAAWTLDQADRAVVQTAASDPSLLFSPFTAAADQVVRARLSAPNGAGFMGFVFGYQGPGHFYLLDWQQAASTHPEFGAAPRGLRLRAFHIPDGGQPTGTDFWSSPDAARVTSLAAHEAPWVAGRQYELVLKHRAGQIELAVLDGASALVSWGVPGTIHAPGQYGFYVNSLVGARFGQVTLPGLAPVLTGVEADGQGNVILNWMGGVAPYLIEAASDLGLGDWIEAAPATPNQSETLAVPPGEWFFRVRSPRAVRP